MTAHVTELAMYKGPADGLRNKLGHWLVCIMDTVRQTIRARRPVLVIYSHVELVIDGTCYSSSFRDKGVRSKVIDDLRTSGHFDIFPIWINADAALARFEADKGEPYDWVGMLRVSRLFRWLPATTGRRFCSEECIQMAIAPPDPEVYSPYDVLRRLVGEQRAAIYLKHGLAL